MLGEYSELDLNNIDNISLKEEPHSRKPIAVYEGALSFIFVFDSIINVGLFNSIDYNKSIELDGSMSYMVEYLKEDVNYERRNYFSIHLGRADESRDDRSL
jgi:hypothetical protein